ncbi:GNAT family N-acetyltransferase [Streptomyces sp. NPDC050560]|uniref:GNAT family N-acetyltransferase n=1 Tax=Streptomyces sp. NPDC050560 TaxID=3365630 RepID=UPI0037B398CC
MTTTLRPTVPLQRGAGGDLSRHYEVCVNGRPVGSVQLATHPDFGPSVAWLEKIFIEEPDRGRGRGTVAALAAEEVARGWGCTRLEASVPADSPAAVRLGEALGYTERNRSLRKALAEPAPALPAGSKARPLTAAEYPRWYEAGRRRYQDTWVGQGLSEDEAGARAGREYAAALPEGLATPDQVIRVLEHEGRPVGTVWVTRRPLGGFVLNVLVEPEYRGRGHGRTLMRVAEAEVAALGCTEIMLNVFAHNTPAMRLYEQLGYRPVEHHLLKPLG